MAKPRHEIKNLGQMRVTLTRDKRRAGLQIPITIDGVPNLIVTPLGADELDSLMLGLASARKSLDQPVSEPSREEKITPQEFDALGLSMVFDFVVGSRSAKPPGIILKFRYGGVEQALSGNGTAKQVDLILSQDQAELLHTRLSQMLYRARPH